MKFLLVGETGSGKSTFINVLANYFGGGNLEGAPSNMQVLIPTASFTPTAGSNTHSERSIGRPMVSQTSKVQSYSWMNGSITFIDTPGFADTAGAAQDDENVLNILDGAAKERELTGIIVVLNGSQPRLNCSNKTVISRLRGNLPDVALENIIYVITNCSSPRFLNFSLDVLPFEPRVVCYMNNSAFSSHPSEWTNRDKVLIQRDWDCSFSVIGQLVDIGPSLRSFPTKAFADIHTFRNYLSTTLQRALDRISQLAALKDRLSDIEAKLKVHQREMDRNRDFKSTKTVYDTEYYTTTENSFCSDCGGRGRTVELHVMLTIFGLMPAQVESSCSSCSGRGQVSESVRRSKKISRIVEDINHQMRSKFEDAKEEHAKCNDLLNRVQREKNDITGEIATIAKDVEAKCQVIKRVCSRFSFRDECDSLIEQFKMSAASMYCPEQKSQARTLIRSLTELATKLEPASALPSTSMRADGWTCAQLVG